MTELPPEVIADDILTRLPVKSLHRFRCVSKSWCSLITSTRFINSHLAKSIQTKTHRKLILQYDKIYSANLDSPNNAVEANHPLKCSNFVTRVEGSCNGLLLLCNCDYDSLPSSLPKEMPNISPFYEHMYHPDQFAVIWNPSTGRYQRLLSAPTEHPFCYLRPQYIQYGLGYDSVGDDYKVVKVMQFYRITQPDCYFSVVKIYSLKLNKWKNIEECPYYLAYGYTHGVFAGGALHWVMRAQSPNSDFVVGAVDLATEQYRVVPLPGFSDVKLYMTIGTLRESLCIFRHYPSNARLDVWIMNEYGVKESWTKAFSFAQPNDINRYKLVHPLAFSKSAREVLLVHENKRLSWYDLEGKFCKDIDLRGLTVEFNSMGYVQSLVQLPHEEKLVEEKTDHRKKTEEKNGDDKNGEEKKEKKIVKKSEGIFSIKHLWGMFLMFSKSEPEIQFSRIVRSQMIFKNCKRSILSANERGNPCLRERGHELLNSRELEDLLKKYRTYITQNIKDKLLSKGFKLKL